MKVRVHLTNGRIYAGETTPTVDGWVSILTVRGKGMSFPDHSIVMIEEL